MNNLWFFWGQEHMTFLRWMTLFSACQVHDNVVLILREKPVCPEVRWKERQDFQQKPIGHNWLPDLASLPVKIEFLENIAPEIAALQAPDVQTSDLLAWWLLSNYGGTVADMDIVFLKPLPEIKQDVQVVVFSGHPKRGYVPVTFMQGRPCSVWWATYANALRSFDPNKYESCGTGALVPKPESGLSEHVVFPWAGKHPWVLWHDWLFKTQWPEIPVDCCGIHWYAGHNQKWNQKINCPEHLKHGAIAWAVREHWKLSSEIIGNPLLT